MELNIGGGKGRREGGRPAVPGSTLQGAAFEGRKLGIWRLLCNVLAKVYFYFFKFPRL